jgi:hypothetical protein
MKKRLISALVLLVSVLIVVPASAKEDKPEVSVEIFEWYCNSSICDLGIDFLIDGHLYYEEGVSWRYRLEGSKWSEWKPGVVDYNRIFIPWVPDQEITGIVQFRYNLPEVSGNIRESFTRITDSY